MLTLSPESLDYLAREVAFNKVMIDHLAAVAESAADRASVAFMRNYVSEMITAVLIMAIERDTAGFMVADEQAITDLFDRIAADADPLAVEWYDLAPDEMTAISKSIAEQRSALFPTESKED